MKIYRTVNTGVPIGNRRRSTNNTANPKMNILFVFVCVCVCVCVCIVRGVIFFTFRVP